MQSTSRHCLAFAPVAPTSTQPIAFGFPRAWVVRRLRAALAEQLYIDIDACQLGYRDDSGSFVVMDDEDGFDGPAFVLRLSHAIDTHPVLDHEVDLHVTILYGHYQVQTSGRRFDIAFLPSTDNSALTTTARWIIRHIDKLGAAR